MEQYIQAMSIGVLALIVVVLIGGAVLGIGKPTNPLAVFLQGWMLGIGSVFRRPLVFFGVLLLAFIGLALDIVFVAAPDLRPEPQTLMWLGLGWRVAYATALAGLMVAHHRGVYDELDGIDYPSVVERPDVSRRLGSVALQCMLIGAIVALLLIGAEFLFSWMLGTVTVGEAFLGFYGASLLVFVVTAFLGLLRPAVAYGDGVGAGLSTAGRRFLPLLTVTALIALPLALVAVLAPIATELLFQGRATRAFAAAGLIAGFTVLQTLALEAALAAFYLRTRRATGEGRDATAGRVVPRAA